MNLKQATERAAEALRNGDLKALAAALEARRAAIRAGEPPTPEILAAGEKLLRGLLEWQRQGAFESARLGQIRSYVEFRKPANSLPEP